MSDLFFPDVSNFQASIDWASLRAKTSVLAMEVNWSLTDTSLRRVPVVRSWDFTTVIWYVGILASSSPAQVASLTKSILGSLEPGEAVCLDWEANNCATRLANAFNVALIRVGIYSNAALFKAEPLTLDTWTWVASYETMEPSIPHDIWQFTDGQYTSLPASEYAPINWPGVGKVDSSVFHGTETALQQALGLTVPVVVPPITSTTLEDGKVEYTVTVPLDKNGDGYVQTAIPFAQFEGATLQGSDPAPTADDTYWHGEVEVQDRNGEVLVSVVGATERASATATVSAWEARLIPRSTSNAPIRRWTSIISSAKSMRASSS